LNNLIKEIYAQYTSENNVYDYSSWLSWMISLHYLLYSRKGRTVLYSIEESGLKLTYLTKKKIKDPLAESRKIKISKMFPLVQFMTKLEFYINHVAIYVIDDISKRCKLRKMPPLLLSTQTWLTTYANLLDQLKSAYNDLTGHKVLPVHAHELIISTLQRLNNYVYNYIINNPREICTEAIPNLISCFNSFNQITRCEDEAISNKYNEVTGSTRDMLNLMYLKRPKEDYPFLTNEQYEYINNVFGHIDPDIFYNFT